ncbi:MAG: hypothetical protein HC774_05755, partial [Sphingomonadales bacterium]|nr:hypothetical protein [Sphingomonadales bacterium]
MAAEILFTSIALTAIIAARYIVFSGLAYWLLWQRGGEKLAAKRLNRDRPMRRVIAQEVRLSLLSSGIHAVPAAIALAVWLIGLAIWIKIDRSMDRYALDAASQDEDAAASVGINVTREKLKITALSSAMCALGGAVFAQYQMYIGPDTIAGLGLSLNIVFAVIARHVGASRSHGRRGLHAGSGGGSARGDPGLGHAQEPARELRAISRPDDLRPAANPVHHLYAERHSRHAHKLVAAARLVVERHCWLSIFWYNSRAITAALVRGDPKVAGGRT